MEGLAFGNKLVFTNILKRKAGQIIFILGENFYHAFGEILVLILKVFYAVLRWKLEMETILCFGWTNGAERVSARAARLKERRKKRNAVSLQAAGVARNEDRNVESLVIQLE
ncbi:uncharacterized protein LOC109845302 [Asparagus officinalis]|uniref:uncharacterized protein LOC109845302 n=1 Tax=Asparagus officinalis TaxID=4686 RepID=UPI00098E710B|nr:uncharacterized protein LOC109845302 [Asparagus officinalis]